MDEEFIRRIELMTECLLRHMGLSPPSSAHIKEEPPSPPCDRVKRDPASLLRPVKEESS